MSLFKLPEKEGDYLFLFADISGDYYIVDNLLFDSDGDAYLVVGDINAVISWWSLPEPNKLC